MATWYENSYLVRLYKHVFYLYSAGNIVGIFERNNIENGGYLCKKYRTAPTPTTIGYNLGYCFPTQGCPDGWTAFNPGSQGFCYFPTLVKYSWDESFRICHALGADLLYLESAAEWNLTVDNEWFKNEWGLEI